MEQIEDDAENMISPMIVPENRRAIISMGDESVFTGRGSYGAHMGMFKQLSIASKNDQREFAKTFKKMILDYSEMFTVPESENNMEEKRELLMKERELFGKVKKQ